MKISFDLGNILPLARKQCLFVCVCAPSPARGSLLFFHSVNPCGSVWEVKGDKGESSKEKVNDTGEIEKQREILKEREV